MKKTKLIFTLTLIISLMLISTVVTFASDNITVLLDGQQIDFDVHPITINNRTMVPVRAIFEALGAKVDWDEPTQTITATRQNDTIELTINSSTMNVNNTIKTLDTPAIMHGDRTLVPVRAISEAFDCQVGWDEKIKTVSIINSKSEFTMVYAPNGRSRAIPKNEVDSYLNVGWYRNKELTDNLTDEKIYNKLKSRGEASAYSCAETVVRNLHKNPDSVRILNREIIDSDKYLRYIVKIEATGMNAAGGYVTDDFYIMLRINPALDGTFTYYTGSILGYEYPYTNSNKEKFEWGIKPADFSLASLPKNAEIVSVKQIVAFPEKYLGKYVTITENFEIGINYMKDKYFHSYPLDNKGYAMTEASIDIHYTYVENLEECVMSEDDRIFKVTGYVRTFSNSTDAYIDASIIEFK